VGTLPAVILGGLGTLLVVPIWMKLFPRLRTVDRLSTLHDSGGGNMQGHAMAQG
jgi:hypothetical protein